MASARRLWKDRQAHFLLRARHPDSCSAGTRRSLVGFKAPLRMLLHRRRPLQGVAPGPLPSPTLADHARKPHLVAAKNVADFMQSSRIGEWRSDRANPYLPDLVACARLSVVDRDPVHLAGPYDVRTHLCNGGRQRSNFGWSSRHIGFREVRRESLKLGVSVVAMGAAFCCANQQRAAKKMRRGPRRSPQASLDQNLTGKGAKYRSSVVCVLSTDCPLDLNQQLRVA